MRTIESAPTETRNKRTHRFSKKVDPFPIQRAMPGFNTTAERTSHRAVQKITANRNWPQLIGNCSRTPGVCSGAGVGPKTSDLSVIEFCGLTGGGSAARDDAKRKSASAAPAC